ncbi:MAG: preprotein translocase subunit YajC [Pseudohongiellaceae bacterium]|jgi:preprotein translocase subunit YajC
MDFFISSAYAQAEAGAQEPSALFNLIFFGGFALIFYFIIWRPQSKRAKEHKDLMGSLNKGDEIMTNGGILGKLTKVDDHYVVVQIHDNVEIKLQKSAITAVLPKGTIKSI